MVIAKRHWVQFQDYLHKEEFLTIKTSLRFLGSLGSKLPRGLHWIPLIQDCLLWIRALIRINCRSHVKSKQTKWEVEISKNVRVFLYLFGNSWFWGFNSKTSLSSLLSFLFVLWSWGDFYSFRAFVEIVKTLGHVVAVHLMFSWHTSPVSAAHQLFH